MSNGTIKQNPAVIAAEVNQQAFEEERAKRLQAEADLTRLSTRIRATDAMLEKAEGAAGYPVNGLIRKARKVLRGDRER